jgi:hypothetical protein
MHYLSQDFVVRKPECLDAKDSLDLMIALSEHDLVATLTDLLSLTAIAEREYARLRQYKKKSPQSAT